MATYTEIGQHSQDVSSSALMDHGSISFGRFTAESLAWEKWSVFRHNRWQEELEMYKSNGLVAQKKAYFEDYYKRVRVLKGLDSEKRETAQVDACTDAQSNSVQLDNGSCGQEEKSAAGAVDVAGLANKESLDGCKGCSDNFMVTDEASDALSNVNREQSSHQTSVSATPPVAENSGVARHDNAVSDPVKLTANEQKKLAPMSVKLTANEQKKRAPTLKAKGNAASARNKSKLESTSTKDAVKASAKSKLLPLDQIAGKRDNILLPGKSNSCMAASGKNSSQVSSRQKVTEIRSSAAVLHPSSTKTRMVPSSPIGRSGQRSKNTSGKDLVHSLRTSLPVHTRTVQNPSKEKQIANDLKDKAPEKQTCPGVARKPSELSSQQMRPKVCRYENQRPNTMSTSISQNRLIRDIKADCARKNYGKERNEKEGGEGTNSICRRDTKSSYNPGSVILNNLKPVHKGEEETSTISRCRRDSKPVSTVSSIVEKNSKPLYKTAESRSGDFKHTMKGTKV